MSDLYKYYFPPTEEIFSSCKYFGAMKEFVAVSATFAAQTMQAITPFPAPAPKYLQEEYFCC
jgi:hypothetical protein